MKATWRRNGVTWNLEPAIWSTTGKYILNWQRGNQCGGFNVIDSIFAEELLHAVRAAAYASTGSIYLVEET